MGGGGEGRTRRVLVNAKNIYNGTHVDDQKHTQDDAFIISANVLHESVYYIIDVTFYGSYR